MKSRFISFCLALSSLAAPVHASGLDQYLVARWTFNGGSLKSDKGGHVLRKLEFGGEATLTFDKGQASLGRGTLLVCEEINAKSAPGLAKAATLWARIRLDGTAPQSAFLFGLRDQVEPADWKNMVFALLARDKPADTSFVFSRFAGGAQLGSPSNSAVLTPGRFFSLALVFDGAARTVTYVVDGQPLEVKHQDAVSLADFNSFAVGRLKEAGAVAMTVDEVRVYSVALTAEWVADIEAVK